MKKFLRVVFEFMLASFAFCVAWNWLLAKHVSGVKEIGYLHGMVVMFALEYVVNYLASEARKWSNSSD